MVTLRSPQFASLQPQFAILSSQSVDSTPLPHCEEYAESSIWITSITLFEGRLGLALVPKGKRRTSLEAAFDKLLDEDLDGRILDFDQAAAEAAAQLAAARQTKGQTINMRDTQIAGIVIARRAAIATRNVRHFSDLDVDVINPWDAQQ